MNAKDKAEELVSKFRNQTSYKKEIIGKFGVCSMETFHQEYKAVKCAKIAVDEILELNIAWINKEIQEDYPTRFDLEQTREFWQEVKQELEKM